MGVEREPVPRLVLVDRVIAVDQLQQVGRGQLDVRAEAAALLGARPAPARIRGSRSLRQPRRTFGSIVGTSRRRSGRSAWRRLTRAPVSSLSPRSRIVSIIPGIEIAAPDRTETSSGLNGSPKLAAVACSRRRMCSVISISSPDADPAGRHVSAARVVVIVKPAGTGTSSAPSRQARRPSAEQLAAPVDRLVERVNESRARLRLRCGLHGEAPLGVSSAVRRARSASSRGRGGRRARRPS